MIAPPTQVFCTIEEVERQGGLGQIDFMQGDYAMSPEEYSSFMNNGILYCTQIIHRYCNVDSFFSHEVVEYHDGKYDEDNTSDYTRIFYAREFPCAEILKLEVDESDSTSASSFTEYEPRSEHSGGQYIPMIEYELGSVYITRNVPSKGYKNVRLTYLAGYPEHSRPYQELKLICIRLVRNLQLLKKKEQEASTIRNTGIRDYSQMFDLYSAGEILTETIATELERYRVKRIPNIGGFS